MDSGDRRCVKQLRWKRQNLVTSVQKIHGSFWGDLEHVEVPEDRFLKLFAQKIEVNKKITVCTK